METVTEYPEIEKFLSADEIVEAVLNTLTPKNKEFFAENYKRTSSTESCDSLTAIFAFSELSRYIRNRYYLWHPDNPFTMKLHVPDFQPRDACAGCDVSPYHPDNFSYEIRERVLMRLKEDGMRETKMIHELKDLGLAK